jgi:hypothetical protein
MSDGASGHWFDRLAIRVTRRQALRATVAGAVVTLPLARPRPARADDASACRKGCVWTSHQNYDSDYLRCGVRGELVTALIYGYGPAVGLGFFSIPLSTYKGMRADLRCSDAALLRQKASQARCLEPFCPGFSPYAKGGPCDGVQDNCCPCATSPNGYIPCSYDCKDPSHSCCPSG